MNALIRPLALVTGTSSGIGRGPAVECARIACTDISAGEPS
jgi:hypothetical protein